MQPGCPIERALFLPSPPTAAATAETRSAITNQREWWQVTLDTVGRRHRNCGAQAQLLLGVIAPRAAAVTTTAIGEGDAVSRRVAQEGN